MITQFWSVELFNQQRKVVNLQFDRPEVGERF